MNFRFANFDDIDQLKVIWKACFNESDKAIEFFFKNKFPNARCVVLEIDKKIISALYMLDTNMVLSGDLCPCYYLYAAGTLPNFQGHGYMSKLIEYANKQAVRLKKRISVLLPASKELYNYYEKQGYKAFFKRRFVTLSYDDMSKYKGACTNKDMSISSMYGLMKIMCKDNYGSVLWSESSFKYAININEIYGGKTVVSYKGYAMCIPLSSNTLLVSELIYFEDGFKELMAKIYSEFPKFNFYKFRFPLFEKCLNGIGEEERFGMIKILDKNLFLKENIKPYLGLTLD